MSYPPSSYTVFLHPVFEMRISCYRDLAFSRNWNTILILFLQNSYRSMSVSYYPLIREDSSGCSLNHSIKMCKGCALLAVCSLLPKSDCFKTIMIICKTPNSPDHTNGLNMQPIMRPLKGICKWRKEKQRRRLSTALLLNPNASLAAKWLSNSSAPGQRFDLSCLSLSTACTIGLFHWKDFYVVFLDAPVE